MAKVPVQKGPIKSGEPTYRTKTYPEKVAEKESDMRKLRDGQTAKLAMPKR